MSFTYPTTTTRVAYSNTCVGTLAISQKINNSLPVRIRWRAVRSACTEGHEGQRSAIKQLNVFNQNIQVNKNVHHKSNCFLMIDKARISLSIIFQITWGAGETQKQIRLKKYKRERHGTRLAANTCKSIFFAILLQLHNICTLGPTPFAQGPYSFEIRRCSPTNLSLLRSRVHQLLRDGRVRRVPGELK